MDEPIEDGFGPVAVFARQPGSQGGVLTIGATCINDRYPAGRAASRIDSHDRHRTHRGRQQQVRKVGLKQFQHFVIGSFLQVGSYFALEKGLQGVEVGRLDGFLEMRSVGGIGLPDHFLPDHLKRSIVVHVDFKGQDAIPDAAPQCRDPMEGDPGDRFAEVVETVVFGLFPCFALHYLRNHYAFGEHELPERASNCGMFRHPLGHNGERALDGFLPGGDGLVLREIFLGGVVDGGIAASLLPELFGQRLQPLFFGGGCFRASLGLEGTVKIPQTVFIVTALNRFL